ncbi:macro domain-containing protein [Aureivirga sp. CE67]|uniref:macro domain-containing protein n=1 Tax=Aureivirga sp. CE67 TaxID=1788983 RepID=UPI0018C99B7D|nr:macro domain-containing protein [Aureivirga sp. CE67]
MEYLLISIDTEMVEAWKRYFSEEANVQIIEDDITKYDVDAIVSPANSFGFMDGGVDLAISKYIGWHVEERLRKRIKESDLGELLIGQTMIIETDFEKIPYVISAPSMRVPMSFNIATSVNAYLAMKATLIAAKKHPKINKISMTSFCTGTGRMDKDIAASQMYQAFLEIEKEQQKYFEDFGGAQKYQYELNKEGMIFDY